MITLGLDQSLNTTGWSILNDGEFEAIGTFKTKPSETIENRLAAIWNELTRLHTIYQFTHIFFEDIQQQRGNVDTYKRLAYVQATILLWCQAQGIEYTILSPSHWRKVLNEKYKIKFGRSRVDQKAAAQQFVKDIFLLSLGEDEADSLCLHHAGLLEYNQNRSAF